MKQLVTVAAWLRFAVRLLLAELRLAGQRRRAVKDLKRLSNRELADIGIARQEIRDVIDGMLARPSLPAPGALAEATTDLRDQAEPARGWPKAA